MTSCGIGNKQRLLLFDGFFSMLEAEWKDLPRSFVGSSSLL